VVSDARDRAFMERALLVAERGRGRTSPNPHVGAVVVAENGDVVGQGAHQAAGGPHAEVVALDAAGDLARGATLYCTLEPCSHTGRTGPCVARVAAAAIRRVVIGVADPNPLVAGRGIAFLRAHGIDVATGVRGEEAARLHAPFFTWVTRHRPFVIAKTAISSDGFVGRSGERIILTGPSADRFFHRQRAEVDAIAVGADTVIADDPLLTARGAFRGRPLTRVVIDWRARVPASSRLFATREAGPVIMVVTDAAAAARRDHLDGLRARGVEVDVLAGRDVREALAGLARRGIVLLLVEGGPTLQRVMAQADVVDRMQVVRAPTALGHGIPAFTLGRPADRSRRLGDDLLMEFDVHGTGRDNRPH
jgi:diaminohydroxyphosphoribosylaminopyrimidine deaminase/5-amino-6-(5-phosphoribosylamino)uracil reductase